MCSMSRIPPHRQKIRSGFPPRELHPPSDPTQPVDLENGEKVSVDILPPTPVTEERLSLVEDSGTVSKKDPDSKSAGVRTQQGM